MNTENNDRLKILDHFRANVPTIPQMFYNTVQNAGHRPANTFKAGKEWKTINYRKWAIISEEIAISLILHGVKKGDDICIMSKLTAQRGWADMAILLTGAVSTAITLLASDKELKYILNRSDVKIIFVENALMLQRLVSLWDQLPSLQAIICLEEDYAGNQHTIWGLDEFRADGRGKSLQPTDLVNYWQRLSPEDPARLDYTSGTTGRLNCSQMKHGEWIKTERQGHRKILLENLNGNYNNVFTSIMPMASIKERTTGFFSMVAIGALIKYGSGPAEIDSLWDLKDKRSAEISQTQVV